MAKLQCLWKPICEKHLDVLEKGIREQDVLAWKTLADVAARSHQQLLFPRLQEVVIDAAQNAKQDAIKRYALRIIVECVDSFTNTDELIEIAKSTAQPKEGVCLLHALVRRDHDVGIPDILVKTFAEYVESVDALTQIAEKNPEYSKKLGHLIKASISSPYRKNAFLFLKVLSKQPENRMIMLASKDLIHQLLTYAQQDDALATDVLKSLI